MAKKKRKYEVTITNKQLEKRYKEFENAVNAAINAIPTLTRSVKDKYNNIVYNGLSKMAEDAVNNFYSKEVKYKNRLFDLFNAYHINADDEDWSIELGPEFMQYKHHQSNEFIYENSFVQGYHGGSIGEDDYGEVFVPFYRGPYGKWTYWTYPAAQDDKSPRDYILEQDPDGYINNQRRLALNEYDDKFMEYVQDVKDKYLRL